MLETLDSKPGWKAVGPVLWDDLELLFGELGGREGCWCMRWRLPREDFEKNKGTSNRSLLKRGIESGEIKGLILYLQGQPVGWCSLGERGDFPAIRESEALAPCDDKKVLIISCLFVAKAHRRQKVSELLVEAAIEYARQLGVKMLEAYPLAMPDKKIPVAAAWTGFESAFLNSGFIEIARRAPLRPIMRFELDSSL